MRNAAAAAVTIIVMVGLIVGLDVAFLRDHGVLRLLVNVAIVATFATAYLLLRRRR